MVLSFLVGLFHKSKEDERECETWIKSWRDSGHSTVCRTVPALLHLCTYVLARPNIKHVVESVASLAGGSLTRLRLSVVSYASAGCQTLPRHDSCRHMAQIRKGVQCSIGTYLGMH